MSYDDRTQLVVVLQPRRFINYSVFSNYSHLSQVFPGAAGKERVHIRISDTHEVVVYSPVSVPAASVVFCSSSSIFSSKCHSEQLTDGYLSASGRALNSLSTRLLYVGPGYYWDGRPSSADKPPQYFTKPPKPSLPPTLSGAGNEYQPKCDDALRLGSWLIHLWINVWVADKTVRSLVNTCHS